MQLFYYQKNDLKDEVIVHKGELVLERTEDLHGDGGSLDGLDGDLEVHTSDNLGLGLDNSGEGELPVELLSNNSKTGLSSLRNEVNDGLFLVGPATDSEFGVVLGVNTERDVQSHSLLLGETLGDLVLNTAKISTTSHLEVTLVSPGGVPGVSQKPVVLAALSSPPNQLDAVTTDVAATLLRVDTSGVGIEESVKVVVDVEASLEGTVVVQLSLEFVDVTAGKSLEGTSVVGDGPLGARVALAGVAAGGGSRARVVGSAALEALVGTGGVTLGDQIVPGSGRVTSVAALLGALKDGLGGDDGARGGLIVDAKTVSVGLDRAEVPARTALLLVQDLPLALGPLFTGIEVGGKGKEARHEAEKKEDLHDLREKLKVHDNCWWCPTPSPIEKMYGGVPTSTSNISLWNLRSWVGLYDIQGINGNERGKVCCLFDDVLNIYMKIVKIIFFLSKNATKKKWSQLIEFSSTIWLFLVGLR